LPADSFQTLGVGGALTSPYLRAVVALLLPVALVIASIHVLYGHDQPGDGFTAGVIVSLAIGFKYVVVGFRETRRQMWWFRPISLLALGILLSIVNGVLAIVFSGAFLAPVDYGAMLGLPLPAGVKLSSGFLFEVAIALSVMGSIGLTLDTLGRPAESAEALLKETQPQEEQASVLQLTGD
jgi:multicomponent K+:H+ antiporter subunit A